MKINHLSKNRLILYIPDEDEKRKYIANILKYLQYDNLLFYYLFFGYEEHNRVITNYMEKYPELNEDKGFIEIEKKDVLDVDFVIDILDEYQIASLYINQIPHLSKKYGFEYIRESFSIFEGYVIKELKYGYIDIIKDDDLPDWDLVKIGISEDYVC